MLVAFAVGLGVAAALNWDRLSDWWEAENGTAWNTDVEITACVLRGAPRAEGTIVNRTNDRRDLAITIELTDSDGALVGHAVARVDQVPPQREIDWEVEIEDLSGTGATGCEVGVVDVVGP